jgi:hypothetical protein
MNSMYTIEVVRCRGVELDSASCDVRLELMSPPDPLVASLIDSWSPCPPELLRMTVEHDEWDDGYDQMLGYGQVVALTITGADAAMAVTEWFVNVASPEIIKKAQAMERARHGAERQISEFLSRRMTTR